MRKGQHVIPVQQQPRGQPLRLRAELDASVRIGGRVDLSRLKIAGHHDFDSLGQEEYCRYCRRGFLDDASLETVRAPSAVIVGTSQSFQGATTVNNAIDTLVSEIGQEGNSVVLSLMKNFWCS